MSLAPLLRDLGLGIARHALNQLTQKPDPERDERIRNAIPTRCINGVYVPDLEPTP